MHTSTGELSRNNIKIHLLKPSYSEPDAALLDITKVDRIPLGEVGVFYYEKSRINKPEWLTSFFKDHAAINAKHFHSAGSKAVLIVPLRQGKQTTLFAIPFGSGRYLLRDNCWDERFGLITALNMLEAGALRAMDKRTLTSNPKVVREQVAKASIAGDFDIDIEHDLIHGITGKTQKGFSDFGLVVTGRESLGISSKVDISNITEIVKKAYSIFRKTDYKKSFDWIDYIKEVKDKPLLAELNEKLVENINNQDENTWLAVPDIVEWADFKAFKYSSRKKANEYQELLISELLKEVGGTATPELLEEIKIYFWSSQDDDPAYQWTLSKCLNTEIDHAGSKYVLNNKKWYKLNKDFVKTVNETVDSIKPAALSFPKYNHKDEEQYNIELSSSIGALCMDREQIYYGGGYSSIEFCDVLTKKKAMIHAKKYGGSAVLSHLFNQGFVSAELFLMAPKFREAVSEKIKDPIYQKLIPTLNPKTADYSIIYLVIQKKKASEEFRLPFFSKVALRKCHRQLTAYGYNVFLNWVENDK